VVASSFAEIFFGNAVMIGLPCVTLAEPELDGLAAASGSDPDLDIIVDLESMTVAAGGHAPQASMPASARHALISGAWDATAMLLADYDEVRKTAARLPYINSEFAIRN